MGAQATNPLIVRSENSSTGRQAVSVAMLGCFSDISMALGELHHCIQVKIDESLETFSAEQRFHGERLDTIESLGRGLCGVVFLQLQLHWGVLGCVPDVALIVMFCNSTGGVERK